MSHGKFLNKLKGAVDAAPSKASKIGG